MESRSKIPYKPENAFPYKGKNVQFKPIIAAIWSPMTNNPVTKDPFYVIRIGALAQNILQAHPLSPFPVGHT